MYGELHYESWADETAAKLVLHAQCAERGIRCMLTAGFWRGFRTQSTEEMGAKVHGGQDVQIPRYVRYCVTKNGLGRCALNLGVSTQIWCTQWYRILEISTQLPACSSWGATRLCNTVKHTQWYGKMWITTLCFSTLNKE